MIQDIAPHQYNNAYKPVPPKKDSFALYYEKKTCLMKKSEEGMTFPTFADLERLNEDIYENYTYLFSIDDKPFYLVNDIKDRKSVV